jgi:hypothetical protein
MAEALMDDGLKVLSSAGTFPRVRLVDPIDSGFILLAAEVDRPRGPLSLLASRKKRRLIEDCKQLCVRIRQQPDIRDASVFRALLAPPGGDSPYLRRRGESST